MFIVAFLICFIPNYDVFIVEANAVRAEGIVAVQQYNQEHQGNEVTWGGIVLNGPLFNTLIIGPSMNTEIKNRAIFTFREMIPQIEVGSRVTIRGKFWKITPIGFIIIGEEIL